MKPIPLMFVGDGASLNSGLARIGRDLATLLSANPRFRVAYCGYDGIGSRKLPFHCYNMQGQVEYFTWPQSVVGAWEDWRNGEEGIIFTVWDLSRLLWIAQPKYLQDETLKGWATDRSFKLWSYVPIDSTGPGNKLSAMSRETMLGIDRILAYTPFGQEQVVNTIGAEESGNRGLDWLPHGLGDTWQPPINSATRNTRIAVVGTNQARKDWGTMAAACAALLRTDPSMKFWWHVNVDLNAWSIPGLMEDYGLTSSVEVTHELSDAQLAACYQICDVTLSPGLGEGFGYSAFESLACGVPVVAIDYAGQASILETLNLPYDWSVKPMSWRLEGQHNCIRPVTNPAEWVEKVKQALGLKDIVFHVEHLRWKNLWPRWNRWFEDGLG